MTRNILAYFHTEDDAKNALRQLKSIGLSEVQLDRISQYPGGSSDEFMNPLTGKTPSLSEITLGYLPEDDSQVLADSDNLVSGYGSSNKNDLSGRNFLLTTAVDDHDYHFVHRILKNYGGML